jgi:hypothetical protein
MIQQTLTHASYYKILIPDPNFPEEPKKPAKVEHAETKVQLSHTKVELPKLTVKPPSPPSKLANQNVEPPIPTIKHATTPVLLSPSSL